MIAVSRTQKEKRELDALLGGVLRTARKPLLGGRSVGVWWLSGGMEEGEKAATSRRDKGGKKICWGENQLITRSAAYLNKKKAGPGGEIMGGKKKP